MSREHIHRVIDRIAYALKDNDTRTRDIAELRRLVDAALTASPQAASEGDEYEVRADGQRVRKDRWEAGFRSIVTYIVGPRTEFEIPDIVERVRQLASPQVQGGEAVAWVEVKDTHEGPYDFHGMKLLPPGKHHLYATPQRAPGVDALIAKWRREADECDINALEADSIGLNDAAKASDRHATHLRTCADELAALASGPSGVDVERDRLWCAAIIATQRWNAELGALACDTAELLHWFNSNRPDKDNTDPVYPSRLAAAPAAQDQGEGNG
jgi:hypothetical protein